MSYDPQYYQDNRERIINRNKEYRKTEKGKASRKRYQQSEKGKETRRIWGRKNYQNNREQILKNQKKYHQTEKGKAALKKASDKYHQTERGKETTKKWRQSENGKTIREIAQKKYEQTEKGKEVMKRYVKNNPEKIKARTRAGQIKMPLNQICQHCEHHIATEKHHEDYDKPLEIEFLCRKCHLKIHAK